MAEAHTHSHAHPHGAHSHGPCHLCDPAAFLRHAEEVCRRDGIQMTPLRRRVLEELARAEKPLGAYDLVERLGREKRIAPISVYRVLDFLIEAGLIHRIATRNTYLPCNHTHEAHTATVFLVCTTCGSVDEVTSDDIARGVTGTAEAAGFKPGSRAVEVEGECSECQAALPR
jgi:Fur family zinc uptake transcriptional regulator